MQGRPVSNANESTRTFPNSLKPEVTRLVMFSVCECWTGGVDGREERCTEFNGTLGVALVYGCVTRLFHSVHEDFPLCFALKR